MNRLRVFTASVLATFVMLLSILSAPVKADQYGFGAITDLFSGLWNEVWPLVALLFIILLILAVFSAPIWIKKVFGMAN